MKLNNKGTLIVISGPSGVGKDSVCNELLKKHNDLYLSVSMTSRSPRPGEVEGKDYFYVTKKQFRENIKEKKFLEHAIVHGEHYGTPKDNVIKQINNNKDVILLIDIQGALKIKRKYKNGIFIFLMPPSMKELKERLVNRGTETKEKIISRFKTAYKEINEISKYNYVVVNDTIENAVNKIEAILLSSKCNVDRIEDLEINNQEELIHELLSQ